MSLGRTAYLPLVVTAFYLMLTSACFANKKAYIPAFTAPVQNYAVIDISGATATSAVDHVALDDANQVAFGYPTGNPVPTISSYSKYQVYTWLNGKLTPLAPLDLFQEPTDLGFGLKMWVQEFPDFLRPSGAVYGSMFEDYTDNGDWDHIPEYAGMFGCPNLPDPPYGKVQNPARSLIYNNTILGVSSGGYVAGDGSAFLGDNYCEYSFIKDPQGHFTLFHYPGRAGTSYDGLEAVAGQVTVNANTFFPLCGINNQGQALGYTDGYGTVGFWDGKTVTPLSSGDPQDLNDQGQVILQDLTQDNLGLYEGGLWENQVTTILRDTLPYYFEFQDWDIQPFSISNQVKPANADGSTSADTDETIHILADALSFDFDPDGKVVFTRDNNNKWHYAHVQLPPGTSIARYNWRSINSSGVIAAIGNGGHALLLVPIYVTADTNNDYQVDFSGPDAGGTGTGGDAAVQSSPNGNGQPPGQVQGVGDQILQYVRFGLWDNAFDASGAIRDGNGGVDNFIGSDSRSFYFSVGAGIITTGSTTPGTMSVHWYTDSDNGGGDATNTITLSSNPKTPNLYSTQALMLVADDADKVPANTGLAGGGDAMVDQREYRLRRAKLGDQVHFKLTPAGSSAAPITFSQPIFNAPASAKAPAVSPNAKDAVETLNVQVVNTRSGTSSSPGPEAPERQGYITTAIQTIKERYAVAGVKANVSYNASSDVLYAPSTGNGAVNLYQLVPSSDDGQTSNQTFSPDEQTVIDLLRAKYGPVSRQGNTTYVIIIGAFRSQGQKGESFPIAFVNQVKGCADGLNCCFVAQSPGEPSIMSAAHELGHLLLNRLPQDGVPLSDPPFSRPTVGHYVGYQEGFNLMYGEGTVGQGKDTDSKRLWNDANHYDGVHSGPLSAPTPPFQMDYLRQSPLLH